MANTHTADHVPGTVHGTSLQRIAFNFHSNSEGYYPWSHFTDEKTDAEKAILVSQ